MAERLGLIDRDVFNFSWVTQFPLLEYDDVEKRYQAMHHPFTAPLEADYDKLADDPLAVRSRAYDLVLNGNEVAGGSIRIHDRKIQELVLQALGMESGDRRIVQVNMVGPVASDLKRFASYMDLTERVAPEHNNESGQSTILDELF